MNGDIHLEVTEPIRERKIHPFLTRLGQFTKEDFSMEGCTPIGESVLLEGQGVVSLMQSIMDEFIGKEDAMLKRLFEAKS